MNCKVSSDIGQKIVGIAVNKCLLKEFNDVRFDYSSGRSSDGSVWSSASSKTVPVVYMDNGTEFQFMLFNPFSWTIGIKIFINDNKISNNYLVLRPGERVWLERFIDSNEKFVFNTYEVSGKSEAVKEAIKNNGNIKVEIYNEVIYRDGLIYNSQPNIHHIYHHHDVYDWQDNPFRDLDPFRYKPLGYEITCDAAHTVNCAATYSAANYSSVDNTVTHAYNNATLTADCSADCAVKASAPKLNSPVNSDRIETGRIEHGGASAQQMNTINGINFEYSPSKTYEFKILPKSQKPVYKNDVQKKFCHECGKKVNPKFKFCPSCGAKL